MLLSTYTKQNMLFFAVEVQVLGPPKKQTTPHVICMSRDWGFVPLYEFTVQNYITHVDHPLHGNFYLSRSAHEVKYGSLYVLPTQV